MKAKTKGSSKGKAAGSKAKLLRTKGKTATVAVTIPRKSWKVIEKFQRTEAAKAAAEKFIHAAPLDNSDALEARNPLIGICLSDTLSKVCDILCVVEDASQEESPLDETKAGIATMLAMARSALKLQGEYTHAAQRPVPEELIKAAKVKPAGKAVRS